jgi:hypothetical protein
VALSILDVVCSSLIYNGIPVHFEIQPEWLKYLISPGTSLTSYTEIPYKLVHGLK